MVKSNISRVVVVKDSRQPAGIITTSELVHMGGIADPYFDRYSSQLLEEQQARGRND